MHQLVAELQSQHAANIHEENVKAQVCTAFNLHTHPQYMYIIIILKYQFIIM